MSVENVGINGDTMQRIRALLGGGPVFVAVLDGPEDVRTAAIGVDDPERLARVLVELAAMLRRHARELDHGTHLTGSVGGSLDMLNEARDLFAAGAIHETGDLTLGRAFGLGLILGLHVIQDVGAPPPGTDVDRAALTILAGAIAEVTRTAP